MDRTGSGLGRRACVGVFGRPVARAALALFAAGTAACDRPPAADSPVRAPDRESGPERAESPAGPEPDNDYVWALVPASGDAGARAVYGPAAGEFDLELSCDPGGQRLSVASHELGGERPTARRRVIRVGDVRADLPVVVEQGEYAGEVLWVTRSWIPLDHPLAAALTGSDEPISFLEAGAREGALVPLGDAVHRAVRACIEAARLRR